MIGVDNRRQGKIAVKLLERYRAVSTTMGIGAPTSLHLNEEEPQKVRGTL